MNACDIAASAEDRSRFFWWLAEWFLSPPDQERLSTLPDPANGWTPDDLPDALGQAWQTLAAANPGPENPPLDNLGVEYTRLFSGMQESLGPPPPYESVWREDRLVGETTVQAIEAYSRAGFADIEPAAGPQDHVGVELKFIALLALREAEAWRAGDQAAARQRLIQQREFMDRHLAAWAPRWALAIGEQAREPLYAALAGMTRASIDMANRELAKLQETAA